jgi:hypothetical protein
MSCLFKARGYITESANAICCFRTVGGSAVNRNLSTSADYSEYNASWPGAATCIGESDGLIRELLESWSGNAISSPNYPRDSLFGATAYSVLV